MDKLIIGAFARDCFDYAVMDDTGLLATGDGYMPYIQSALGSGGDQLSLTIDLKTGQIVGWKPMTAEDIVKILED